MLTHCVVVHAYNRYIRELVSGARRVLPEGSEAGEVAVWAWERSRAMLSSSVEA